MKTQATKRPWEEYEYGSLFRDSDGILHQEILHGDYVSDRDESKENAKLIVKAVNCHDELVEALNAVVRDGQDNRVIDMDIFENVLKVLKKAEKI